MGCCILDWKKTEYYQGCLEEVDQQLDIINLMKRLLFMERAVSCLMSEHQLDSLYLQDSQLL